MNYWSSSLTDASDFDVLFPLSHFRFILRYGSQRGCQAEPEMHMFLVKTTFYRGPPSKQFFLTFFLWFCATRVSHQAAAALYLPLLHTTRIQKISISTCFGGLQALLSVCFFFKVFSLNAVLLVNSSSMPSKLHLGERTKQHYELHICFFNFSLCCDGTTT